MRAAPRPSAIAPAGAIGSGRRWKRSGSRRTTRSNASIRFPISSGSEIRIRPGEPGPERPEGAGQAQDDPVGLHTDYFLPRRFFLTYAQIFFVISEGPMGLSPMTDSSVSVQPLKLSE